MLRILVPFRIVGSIALIACAQPLLAQSAAVPAAASANPKNDPASVPSPAVTLPALNLPSIASPAAATTSSSSSPQSELPATVATTQGADGSAENETTVNQAPEKKPYSYGDAEFSILFLPDQVNRMKESLRTFEDTGAGAALPAPVIAQIVTPVVPEKIDDPLLYPTFYLASIAFENANDWTVWLSGYKITSRRNVTDVTVLNVTRDSATFLWKPSFMKAIVARNKDKLFVPVDKVKHKLTSSQLAALDSAAGSIVFTLKPNQTFAPGYFKTFEGYIDGPTLEALPVSLTASPDSAQAQQGSSADQAFDADGNPIDDGLANNNQGIPSTNFNPQPLPSN